MAVYKKPAAPKKPAPAGPPRPPGLKANIRSNEGLSFLKGKMRSTAKDKPLTAKEKAAGNARGLKAANSGSKMKSVPSRGRGGIGGGLNMNNLKK